MEPRWDIAAVVVAMISVPLAMSPTASRLLASLFRIFIRTIWPAKARCERLEWIDIPEGLLHECTLPSEHCEHIKAVGRKRSWDNMIGAFFTLIRRGTFVKKPHQLDWYTDYVRTDYKSLKAMVLLLQTFSSEGTRTIGNPKLDVVFKEVGNIWTAYIKVSPIDLAPPRRLKITKYEMECFLKGYPPWYQQPLVLANGNAINNPIKEVDDISRGGWIVAIGLSPAQPIANDHLDCFYRDDYKPSGPIFNALLRLHHCLRNIAKALPEEKIISEAEELMRRCEENHYIWTNSTLGRLFCSSELSARFNTDPEKCFWFSNSAETARYASALSDAQCVLIMRIFSKYNDPTTKDIQELRPVLYVAIRVAMTGVYAVARYMITVHNPKVFERNRRALLEWPEQIKSRSIYLRDRFEDEDI